MQRTGLSGLGGIEYLDSPSVLNLLQELSTAKVGFDCSFGHCIKLAPLHVL